MGDKSKIEWCDATWSPITGCTPTSEGCRNCYAERMARRLEAMGQRNYANGFEVTCHPHMLERPFRWKKPRRIFVCSMGDLFHYDVPFKFIAAVFGVMAANPQHTFQVLTKRPERMLRFFEWLPIVNRDRDSRLECAWRLLMNELTYHPDGDQGPIHCKWGPGPDGPWPLPNVWLGVSAEIQQTADKRIPLLLQCPAVVRFVSCEPLLGLIEIGFPGIAPKQWGHGYTDVGSLIHQIIVGGETGPGARPMHPDWARSIRDQCREADVPFFFKQWGAWQHGSDRGKGDIVLIDGRHGPTPGSLSFDRKDYNVKMWHQYDPQMMVKVGKKAAGRILDGRTWDEFPTVTGD